MNDHVVMLSGGLCSFHAAHRVLQSEDREKVTLLFCDTLIEAPDLYRFLDDATRALNHPITRISHGKTPWELFHEQGMIGNTRADLCSRILKRELADNWVKKNCAPNPVLYFGFDFTESHRLEGVTRSKPWATCRAPLINPPYMWKSDMERAAVEMGVAPSDSYKQGFTHDNCGGFCVKAGHSHFARLLHQRPEVYAFNEAEEAKFRERTGKDVSILRDRRGGKTKPLTMEQFRKNIEHGATTTDDDAGGCNCFATPPDALTGGDHDDF